MHRFCTDFSVDFENVHTAVDYYNEEAETEVIDILRDFMLWIYKRLDKEYEYQTTEEAIKETLIGNEYLFTKNGEID